MEEVGAPSGRGRSGLVSDSGIYPRGRVTVANATVQALARESVEIPPGAQMSVPVRYRKRLQFADSEAGVLLTPSNTATQDLTLVGAQTVLRTERSHSCRR
ncbi:unnamed protein product [Lampetra planeri]